MAKIETLWDNFDDNSLNPALWSTYTNSGGTVVETGGQLVITPAASVSAYNGLQSVTTNFDFTNSVCTIEVVQAVSNSTGSEMAMQVLLNTNNMFGIMFSNNALTLRSRVAGVTSDTGFTRNTTTMRWWRLRHDGSLVYWDTSPDGITWTNRRSLAPGFAITSTRFELGAGTYQSVASPGAAIFDNLNTLSNVPLGWIQGINS